MTFAQFFSEASLENAVVGQRLLLTGNEARHAEVKRIKPGEVIAVSDGAASRIVGEATDIAPGEITVVVTAVERHTPEYPQLGLVQALAKNARDEKAIEICTELGVNIIIPWQSDHSIVKWDVEKELKARQKWKNVVTAAAKQSRRITVPRIEECSSTEKLLARIYNAVPQQNHGKPPVLFVLDEQAEFSLAAAVRKAEVHTRSAVTVVVGPEGGLSARERKMFSEPAAQLFIFPVRLGAEILRSSTAGAAALSVINYILGRW